MFSIKSALPLPKSEFLDTLLEFIPGISDAFVINQIVRCHSHNWNAFNSTLWRTEAFIFRRVHWNWILCIVDYTQRTQTVVDCLLLAARLKCCNVTCIAHTTNLCLFLSAHLFTSIDSWGSIICFWHWRMYLLCVCAVHWIVHFVFPIVISMLVLSFFPFSFCCGCDSSSGTTYDTSHESQCTILWLQFLFHFSHFVISLVDLGCYSHSHHPATSFVSAGFSASFYAIKYACRSTSFYCADDVDRHWLRSVKVNGFKGWPQRDVHRTVQRENHIENFIVLRRATFSTKLRVLTHSLCVRESNEETHMCGPRTHARTPCDSQHQKIAYACILILFFSQIIKDFVAQLHRKVSKRQRVGALKSWSLNPWKIINRSWAEEAFFYCCCYCWYFTQLQAL